MKEGIIGIALQPEHRRERRLRLIDARYRETGTPLRTELGRRHLPRKEADNGVLSVGSLVAHSQITKTERLLGYMSIPLP